MKKIILALTVLLVIFTVGCSSPVQTTPVKPPVDYVKAKTMDGKGMVVLVLREWDNALAPEEMEQIKNDLQQEWPQVENIPAMKVEGKPDLSNGSRVIAFVYATYTDRVPHPYTWSSANDQRLDVPYDRALKIFARELAGLDNWGYIE